MTINKQNENEKLTLSLKGRLDTITSNVLHSELIPEFETNKEICLDFSALDYVSSAGLRVLLIGQKTAKAKGASMTVTNISKEIMEILDMTGFSDMLTIV